MFAYSSGSRFKGESSHCGSQEFSPRETGGAVGWRSLSLAAMSGSLVSAAPRLMRCLAALPRAPSSTRPRMTSTARGGRSFSACAEVWRVCTRCFGRRALDASAQLLVFELVEHPESPPHINGLLLSMGLAPSPTCLEYQFGKDQEAMHILPLRIMGDCRQQVPKGLREDVAARPWDSQLVIRGSQQRGMQEVAARVCRPAP